jgi:uncharacterized BrkB/YihY/UPF0761 family membrane protein
VERVTQFVRSWWNAGIAMYRRGDPLLMGAAIAYNSLFALVPLAAAFVAIVTLLDLSESAFTRIIDFMYSALPEDVAAFLESLLTQSDASIATDQAAIAVVSILVALWSGSRAVYAIQKSLRLVQGIADDRGYLLARGIGIGVTIAAGASIMVGYAVLLFGETAWERTAEVLYLPNVSAAQILVSVVVFLWIFGLLYVIYRFGPPAPVDLPIVTAALVATVLILGTRLAVSIAPSIHSDALAVFGTMGVLLLWLYGVGVVVVAVPMLVEATRSAVADLRQG